MRQEHWDVVYNTKNDHQVSWYEAVPAVSLRMMESAGLTTETCIIDVAAVTRGWSTGWRLVASIVLPFSTFQARPWHGRGAALVPPHPYRFGLKPTLPDTGL
jgi:hypothetical protein